MSMVLVELISSGVAPAVSRRVTSWRWVAVGGGDQRGVEKKRTFQCVPVRSTASHLGVVLDDKRAKDLGAARRQRRHVGLKHDPRIGKLG